MMMMADLLLAENMMSVVFPAPSLAWKRTRLDIESKSCSKFEISSVQMFERSECSNLLTRKRWTQLNSDTYRSPSVSRVAEPLRLSRSTSKTLQTYTKTEEQTPSIELEIPISRCSFRFLADFFGIFIDFPDFSASPSTEMHVFNQRGLSPSHFEARCQRQRSRFSRFRHWRSVDNLRVLKMGDFHWKDIILCVFLD